MGEISLGQGAEMTVGSFLGENFGTKVSYICDQVDFTPRKGTDRCGVDVHGTCSQAAAERTGGKLNLGLPGILGGMTHRLAGGVRIAR